MNRSAGARSTLVRQWHMLHALLRHPRKTTAREIRARLASLRTLTPGDIVAALEHVARFACGDLDRIRAALAEGERLKSRGSAAAIGFIPY